MQQDIQQPTNTYQGSIVHDRNQFFGLLAQGYLTFLRDHQSIEEIFHNGQPLKQQYNEILRILNGMKEISHTYFMQSLRFTSELNIKLSLDYETSWEDRCNAKSIRGALAGLRGVIVLLKSDEKRIANDVIIDQTMIDAIISIAVKIYPYPLPVEMRKILDELHKDCEILLRRGVRDAAQESRDSVQMALLQKQLPPLMHALKSLQGSIDTCKKMLVTAKQLREGLANIYGMIMKTENILKEDQSKSQCQICLRHIFNDWKYIDTIISEPDVSNVKRISYLFGMKKDLSLSQAVIDGKIDELEETRLTTGI